METLDIFNRIGNDPTYLAYAQSLVALGLTSERIQEELAIAGWFYAPYEEFALPYALPDMDLGSQDVIIVGTGAYNPLHEGHVSMFDKAKETLEAMGYNVALGVVSLGHDSYIMRKTPNSPNVHARVRQCREFVKDSEWLHVDIWESMGVSQDVNFTAVLDHVSKAYPKAKVFYIFGGDNNGFAKAFTTQDKYGTLCVSRPGYVIEDKCPETIYVEGDNDMSSTKVRSNANRGPSTLSNDLTCMIRTDADRALSWIPERYDSNVSNARKLISEAFEAVFSEVEYLDVEEQVAKMRNLQEVGNFTTISADPWFEGDYQLRISRVFETYGLQHSITDYYFKEAPEIAEDVKKLVFVDDDSATGYTRNIVSNLYGIDRFVTLNSLITNIRTTEILDERDFLFGAKFGGLVVKRNGATFRVPYLPPFVDLLNRASIPDDNAQVFWERILEANRSLYTGTGIVVTDIPVESRDWILDKGFNLESSMEEVAEYMISSAKSCAYNALPQYETVA